MAIKPWLYLPAKWSNKLGPLALRLYASFKKAPVKPQNCYNLPGLDLKFYSPFGTAGGVDKSGKSTESWFKLGAGFIELGTFTPLAQKKNPGLVIRKNAKSQCLWNAMGFPNAGFDVAHKEISKFKKKYPEHCPLFINIGKNRSTPLEKAQDDYLKGLERFKTLADAIVINISSPNTKDLRNLHDKDHFEPFALALTQKAQQINKPIFLKLSPDLESETFDHFLELAENFSFDGYILTNTTVSRPYQNINSFPQHGGLSGKGLAPLAIQRLKQARATLNKLGSSKKLISVGGVLSPEEAQERLKLGADLVQMYSGLIFYGPGLLKSSDLLWRKN